jgi:hypothetical protein
VAAERSSIERVAEIPEALFLKEPELTAELLVDRNTADLVRLFGGPSTAADAPSVVETVSGETPAAPGPIWSKRGAGPDPNAGLIQAEAERELMTVSEFTRCALIERLQWLGIDLTASIPERENHVAL